MRTAIENSRWLLTTDEVAELLRLHPATVRIARSRNTLVLPHVRFGRTVRYRREDVEAFIDAHVCGGVK